MLYTFNKLRRWGKGTIGELIIGSERSAIWAADVDPDRYFELVPVLANIGLGGVKLGFDVGLGAGLAPATDAVKSENPELTVIYDHQKAGNDIPGTGAIFARRMRASGVDAAILFPFSGLDTQRAWTEALQEENVGVIVGAEMTHPGIRDHLDDGDFEDIFDLAIGQGVTNFVVPGNKVPSIERWKAFFDERLGEGEYAFFSPGLIKQGGVISETGQAAGRIFHGIIGSAIHGKYDASTKTYERSVSQVRDAAIEIAEQVENSRGS